MSRRWIVVVADNAFYLVGIQCLLMSRQDGYMAVIGQFFGM